MKSAAVDVPQVYECYNEFMDAIRRAAADPGISLINAVENDSVDQDISQARGISDISDQIEPAQANKIFAPDWTSGNESDPGITMLELPSFLWESILYRTEQIMQRSPHLSSLAITAAEPFYRSVTESMKTSDVSNDSTLIHDQLSRMNETTYANLGSINNDNIEALCFLVLMQATKSAQEDLKAIMAHVNSINNAKASLRENMNTQYAAATSAANDPPTDLHPEMLQRFLTSAADALSSYTTNSGNKDDDPD